ncbi:2-phosphosulfolactate phosphatase [Brevibacillus brevis]|uniref:Probable 2-phosphosulfolactate phosphatase n=1 Tax=Brevibacillus brevis TaxID=1393 RepID=A0ABY9SWI0_BREBE|nr:2-phosphosulfolactate phosphatase [Brevibacillus brevis]WNC12175.1 2-phosphosulfolactate phosphatase [Brevibacillus brevis]
MTIDHVFRQVDYSARFEWGSDGVTQVGAGSDIVVIVDILSFTTCVDIVSARGGAVFPYRVRDDTAAAYAKEKGAILADKRGGVAFSLSPASLSSIPAGTRIVLPSPNGSTCTVLAQQLNGMVIAACLRNAAAVSSYIRELGASVTVIASGERWQNGALRPAIEDMIGAGAVLEGLPKHRLSPEAQLAVAVYQSAKCDLSAILAGTGSGRELIAKGYAEDVDIAACLHISDAVPILNQEMAYTSISFA